MNELVFLEPNDIKVEPFTTSEVISQNTKNQHHTITRLIRKYEKEFEKFGKLTFETRSLINGFEIHKSKAGRPEKVFHLNEAQATLLMTFLRNNDIVIDFKCKLVKQFFTMYKELNSRKVTRQIAKQSREALTNAIQALPESPHKSMKYKHFTDLVYKIVFGKNAKQLRDEYGISTKDNLRDRFTAEENSLVEKLENQISVLLDLGHDYGFIKNELCKNHLEKAV